MALGVRAETYSWRSLSRLVEVPSKTRTMALSSAIGGVRSSSRRRSIMARPCDGIQEVGLAGRSISGTEFSTEGSTPPATEVVAETVNKGP